MPSENQCTTCQCLKETTDKNKNKKTIQHIRTGNCANECLAFIIILLCLSIKMGAAPRDATVSTRKRQLCLMGFYYRSKKLYLFNCKCTTSLCLIFNLLLADVSNPIYWVTETSRRLSMCEEKQDRLMFFNSLREEEGIITKKKKTKLYHI